MKEMTIPPGGPMTRDKNACAVISGADITLAGNVVRNLGEIAVKVFAIRRFILDLAWFPPDKRNVDAVVPVVLANQTKLVQHRLSVQDKVLRQQLDQARFDSEDAERPVPDFPATCIDLAIFARGGSLPRVFP